MNAVDLLADLTLFFGDASDAEARIYAALPRTPELVNATLAGRVIGPDCLFSETLTSTIPLIDRGPGPTLLAQAIVPDACCWTPDLPFQYRVEVSLTRGGETLGTAKRQIGIRRLGVRGKNFSLEGKRWVPRGVQLADDQIDLATIDDCHSTGTVLLINTPSEATCALASECGVLIFADLQQSECVSVEATRLAHWPAVAAVLLPRRSSGLDVAANNTTAAQLRARNRNLLLGEAFTAEQLVEPSASPHAWAHFALIPAISADHLAAAHAKFKLPVVMTQQLLFGAIAEGRAACDRLQAELAAVGDFAGYFTVSKEPR